MMDAAVVTNDLDRLAERVERAAALVVELRAKTQQLEHDKAELARALDELRGRLQGQEPGALIAELATLRRERLEWQGERKDVANRIEALLKKLERLE